MQVVILSTGKAYSLRWLLLWVQGTEGSSDYVCRQAGLIAYFAVISTGYRGK